MNSLGAPLRFSLPIAGAVLLLLTGCGTEPASTANRPDITAAMPVSGDKVVSATKVPRTRPAKAGHPKALHPKALHPKALHPKARHPKARPTAGQWGELVDKKSGIRFSLPQAVLPTSKDVPLPRGGTLHSRVYTSRSTDGFEVTAAIQDFEGSVAVVNLRGVSDEIVARLRSSGASDARVERSSTVSVAGHPGMDSTISFTTTDGVSRKIWRIRAVLDGQRLVSMQTVGYGARDTAGLRARVSALQRRLNASVVLG